MRYSWPGNVRELENVIERAVVMGKGTAILTQDLPLEIQRASCLSQPTLTSTKLSLKERIAELEKELISNALKETHWVQTKAAKLLGMSRRIVKYKMEKYGIKRGEKEPASTDLFVRVK